MSERILFVTIITMCLGFWKCILYQSSKNWRNRNTKFKQQRVNARTLHQRR